MWRSLALGILSTIFIVTLYRQLVQETGKNLVLSGVGRVQLVDGFRDTSKHFAYLRHLSNEAQVDMLTSYVPYFPRLLLYRHSLMQ